MQTEMSLRIWQPANEQASHTVASDPHRSVAEIAWAWGKAADEPSDKLFDALVEVMCESVLGDAVFSVRDGELSRWTSQDIRDIARGHHWRYPAYKAAYREAWRMRRSDFAQWYGGSYLAAAALLDSFWPGSEHVTAKTRGRERRRPMREIADKALAELYRDGCDEVSDKDLIAAVDRWCRKRGQISKDGTTIRPSDSTIRRSAGRRQ